MTNYTEQLILFTTLNRNINSTLQVSADIRLENTSGAEVGTDHDVSDQDHNRQIMIGITMILFFDLDQFFENVPISDQMATSAMVL